MEYESATKLFPVVAVDPQGIATNTVIVGPTLDTKGYRSLTFFLSVVEFVAGVFTMTIEHGDESDMSDAQDVLTTDDPQTLVPANLLNLKQIAAGLSRVGYIGKKRYLRVTLTSTGVTGTGATAGVFAIEGDPLSAPTPDQASAS